jgi:hypothetical protein
MMKSYVSDDVLEEPVLECREVPNVASTIKITLSEIIGKIYQ